jgi:hypothetical protein
MLSVNATVWLAPNTSVVVDADTGIPGVQFVAVPQFPVAAVVDHVYVVPHALPPHANAAAALTAHPKNPATRRFVTI